MNMAIFHSIWTVVVMVIFIGIVIWAYSSKRKERFDEAARLPFDEGPSTDNDKTRQE